MAIDWQLLGGLLHAMDRRALGVSGRCLWIQVILNFEAIFVSAFQIIWFVPSTHHIPLITYHSTHTTHHTPLITHHWSRTTHHTPLITHHSTHTTRHTPLNTHHSSHTTLHTPLITHHSSHTTHHVPLITHHPSHTTHHTPLITHHSSHTTHHTPLIMYHSSHTTHHTPLATYHSHSALLSTSYIRLALYKKTLTCGVIRSFYWSSLGGLFGLWCQFETCSFPAWWDGRPAWFLLRRRGASQIGLGVIVWSVVP